MSGWSLKESISRTVNRFNAWRTGELNCIHFYKSVLFHLGLMPDDNDDRGLGALFRKLAPGTMLCIYIYFDFIGNPIFAFNSWGTNLHFFVEAIGGMFGNTMILLHMHCLLFHGHRVQGLFQTLEALQLWSKRLPKRPKVILAKTQRMSEKVLIYVSVSLFLGVNVYGQVPSLLAERDLLFHTWYPFNEYQSPHYELLFVATILNQAYAVCLMLFVNVILMSLLVELIGHYRLLSYNLRRATRSRTAALQSHEELARFWRAFTRDEPGKNVMLLELDDNVGQRGFVTREEMAVVEEMEQREVDEEETHNLRVCVQYHHCIIRLVEEIQELFDHILTYQLICTLVPSGLSTALIINTDKIDSKIMVVIVMVVSCNVITTVFCWLADKMAEESLLVRDAVFGCDWIGASEEFKRSMRIIMSLSNQPAEIRVAGFISLSMDTLYSVIKLNYSHLTAMLSYFETNAKK